MRHYQQNLPPSMYLIVFILCYKNGDEAIMTPSKITKVFPVSLSMNPIIKRANVKNKDICEIFWTWMLAVYLLPLPPHTQKRVQRNRIWFSFIILEHMIQTFYNDRRFDALENVLTIVLIATRQMAADGTACATFSSASFLLFRF